MPYTEAFLGTRNRWQTDEAMGWQILNGVHPLAYHKCKETLPDYFNVTDDDVKYLCCGKTIDELIKVSYVWFVQKQNRVLYI